nr:hypothetical protein [Candidatus Neomarinimicrobiota bacterium]
KSAAMSLGWILLLVFSQRFIFHPAEGLYLKPFVEMIGFLIMNTIVSGLIIGTFLKLKQNSNFMILKYDFQKISYAMPVSLLLVAIFCEIGNSLLF